MDYMRRAVFCIGPEDGLTSCCGGPAKEANLKGVGHLPHRDLDKGWPVLVNGLAQRPSQLLWPVSPYTVNAVGLGKLHEVRIV